MTEPLAQYAQTAPAAAPSKGRSKRYTGGGMLVLDLIQKGELALRGLW